MRYKKEEIKSTSVKDSMKIRKDAYQQFNKATINLILYTKNNNYGKKR